LISLWFVVYDNEATPELVFDVGKPKDQHRRITVNIKVANGPSYSYVVR